MEGQKRVDSILQFAVEDALVMFTIDWLKFCDLARIVLLASICTAVSEDVYRKLRTNTLTGRHLATRLFAPEVSPMRPDAFMICFESFHAKILSIESKKLHLDMIEGRFSSNTIVHIHFSF